MAKNGARIFISYAHADAAIAEVVVGVLAEIGLAPWLDRSEVRPGDSFVDKMNQGLGRASYVVLLLSRAALASHWVSREWMSALAAAETVILPLLIEDCDIPPLLRDIVYIDLRRDRDVGLASLRSFFLKEREPAAATPEFRGGSDGLNLREVSRRTLRLLALRCMSEANLDAFLFDAEVDAGMLQGSSLHERITSLLVRVASDGVLGQFADWLALEPGCTRCVSNELKKLREQEPWALVAS